MGPSRPWSMIGTPRSLQRSAPAIILGAITVLQLIYLTFETQQRGNTESTTLQTSDASSSRASWPSSSWASSWTRSTDKSAGLELLPLASPVAPDFERVDQLPLWLRDYVELNQNLGKALEGEEQEGSAPARNVSTLQYRCGSRCGGTGDRISGIVQSFYMALCTGRPLFIDWTSPDPLYNYLEPNFIHWEKDVKAHPNQTHVIEALDQKDNEFLRNPNLLEVSRDVQIRTNVWLGDTIVKEMKCVKNITGLMADGVEPTDLYRAAFWTLFKWSPLVMKGVQELRRELILNSPTYVAVHIRTGTIQGTADLELATSDETTWPEYLTCAQAFQKGLQDICQQSVDTVPIFLAADTTNAKKALKALDANIRTKMEMEIYHIDRTSKLILQNAQQAALDVFRELKILMDSTCIVMTRNRQAQSKYARLALLLPTQPRCSAFWDDCGSKVVAEQLSHVMGRC